MTRALSRWGSLQSMATSARGHSGIYDVQAAAQVPQITEGSGNVGRWDDRSMLRQDCVDRETVQIVEESPCGNIRSHVVDMEQIHVDDVAVEIIDHQCPVQIQRSPDVSGEQEPSSLVVGREGAGKVQKWSLDETQSAARR